MNIAVSSVSLRMFVYYGLLIVGKSYLANLGVCSSKKG